MVRKGDEKLRFLMERMPGMREVAVPKPGTKPHASYFFKQSRFPRGHTFFMQDSVAIEPAIYVVVRGSVEFFRADSGGDESSSSSKEKLLMRSAGGFKKTRPKLGSGDSL